MLLLHFIGVMASSRLDRINSLRESLAAVEDYAQYVEDVYPEARGWEEEEEWLEDELTFDDVLSREARSVSPPGSPTSTECPSCTATNSNGRVDNWKVAKCDNNCRTYRSNYNSHTLPNVPNFLRGATIFQGATEYASGVHFDNTVTLATNDANVQGNFYVLVMAGGKGQDAGMGGEDGTLAALGWQLLSTRADGMIWDKDCTKNKRMCDAPKNHYDIWRSPDNLSSVELPQPRPRFRTQNRHKKRHHTVIPFFKAGAPTDDPPVIDPAVQPRVLDASSCHTADNCKGWGVEAADYMQKGAQMYNSGPQSRLAIFNFDIPSYLQGATYYRGSSDFQSQDGGSNVMQLRGGTVGSNEKECGSFYMLVHTGCPTDVAGCTEGERQNKNDGHFLQSLPASGWTRVETIANPGFMGNSRKTQYLAVFKSPGSAMHKVTLPGSKKYRTANFNQEWVRAHIFFKSGGACGSTSARVCYDFTY